MPGAGLQPHQPWCKVMVVVRRELGAGWGFEQRLLGFSWGILACGLNMLCATRCEQRGCLLPGVWPRCWSCCLPSRQLGRWVAVLGHSWLWEAAGGSGLTTGFLQLACLLGVVYLTGFAAVFASVAVVHRSMCVRSVSPAAPRPALFHEEGCCPLDAQPAPDQPQPELPDVSAASSTRCLGENETTEELRCGGVTATALYLWGSVMTALSYPKAPDLAQRRSPLQGPFQRIPTACERSNRTAPAAPPSQPGLFGLAVLPVPPALHCHACLAGVGPPWGAAPNRKDWLDPLGLRQCSLHTAMDLSRIKSFIFPS